MAKFRLPVFPKQLDPDFFDKEPWAIDKLRHYLRDGVMSWPEGITDEIEFRNKMLQKAKDEPISQAEKDARTAREMAYRKNWFSEESLSKNEQDKLDEAVKKAEEVKC